MPDVVAQWGFAPQNRTVWHEIARQIARKGELRAQQLMDLAWWYPASSVLPDPGEKDESLRAINESYFISSIWRARLITRLRRR